MTDPDRKEPVPAEAEDAEEMATPTNGAEENPTHEGDPEPETHSGPEAGDEPPVEEVKVLSRPDDTGGTSPTATTSVQAVVGDATNVADLRTAGFTEYKFAGPGFADGEQVTVSVNISGVSDTTTLVEAINAGIDSAGNGSTQAATWGKVRLKRRQLARFATKPARMTAPQIGTEETAMTPGVPGVSLRMGS